MQQQTNPSIRVGILSAVLALFLGGSAEGQSSAYELRLVDTTGLPGTTVTVPVELDNLGGGVEGFSFSVCAGPGVVTPVEALMGEDLLSLNEGYGAVGFGFVIGGDDISVVVVNDFVPPSLLPEASDLRLVDLRYAVEGAKGTATELSFCTAGDPPIATLLVVDAQGIEPVQVPGTVFAGDPTDPSFIFGVESSIGFFDQATGIGSIQVNATLADAQDVGSPTYGFSMALTHDPSILAATLALPQEVLSALNGGTGPEFFGVDVLTDGITIGVAYSLSNPLTLIFESMPQAVVTVQYATVASAVQGAGETTTGLSWSSGLGEPSVQNLVVVSLSGETMAPTLLDGTITLRPEGEFQRGDCNGDGGYSIGDAFALLGYLFQNGRGVGCEVACDADDDGALALGDGLYILQNIFTNGPNPSTPFGNCGGDPSPDALTCASFPPCL